METKINILKPFFEYPNREFYIRELSRILKINHTTVRQQLNKLVKEKYLKKIDSKPFPIFKPDLSKKFLNLKLYYNLEKLRKSNLIEDLEKEFEFPVIVLFGSYAFALDDDKSDIDICIITETNKDFNTTNYEKLLNRKVSLHIFIKKDLKKTIEKNSGLINNICNGIVLSGQLEII